ncbi:MAG: outer membrane protein assembly factor [Acidimicrobiia bacterium]
MRASSDSVRRHLVTSGDLGSIVVGRIDHPATDTKRLRIDVTPGAPVTGREIRYTGNQALNRQQLDAVIAQAGLQVEAWLDRSVVERALRQAYNEDGFLKAEVTGRPLTIDGTVGVLLVEIKEGPQAHITNVTWAGVGEARQADVQKAAKLPPPLPYVAGAVNDARRRVEDFYSAAGFNAAAREVQPAVAADDTVSLAFVVTEGPQQVLAGVQLSGNEVTKSEVLTEALKFELGKPVNLDEWALARKRLYDTNVFRAVDIQPTPQGDVVDGVQQVKAVITVEEYPSWSLRYGFQFEGDRREELGDFTSTRNAGVVSEIRNPNLLGRALTGGVFGMYTRDQRDATVFLATSRLFGWAARSTLYGFFSRDRLRDDSGSAIVAVSDRQGISVDQRWKPKGFQVVYGYRFERNHTYDPDPGLDPFPLDAVANLAKLSTAVVFDGRDDPINSRKGFFSAVSLDEAALFLGSDVRNRKLLMQQFVFVPLKRVVSATRAQVGFAFGPDQLAFTDRFRAGGATSVRGYGEESLAGRGVAGLPEVGNRLIILNQELRFPLYRWANAVAFIDAGNIFRRGEKLSGLKVGYGVGLRFDTPVGLIRGDLGFPASALGTASRKPKFYFGLGHIF